MAERYADTVFLIRRVPEAAAVDAADADALGYALDDAEPMIDVAVYGPRAELAHAFYTAHLLAVRYPALLGGERGPVSSMSAGEISASYETSTATMSEDRPSSTRWGRLFLQQQRIAGAGLRVVG